MCLLFNCTTAEYNADQKSGFLFQLHLAGKLDIRAMDETCPSWVKLQSVSYGVPFENVAYGKPASTMGLLGASQLPDAR